MDGIRFRRFGAACLVFVLMLLFLCSFPAFASEEVNYNLGEDSLVNAGKDTGYSKSDALDKNDPHWGWQLGQFYVNGFTRVSIDEDGNPVLLKNVGDTITLWFSLFQDIDCLNGDDQLFIYEDKNGWDKHLGVAQQNFGRGALIVKQTDYLNNSTVNVYQDFLAANMTTTADTKVEVFEEGDYEVALDYEIAKAAVNILGWEPLHSFTNYRITFKFSIRNGNSMVFPFDVITGAELTNASVTENGFYLDLAKSRYLDIDISRKILEDGAEGLTEDIRFNKPARDGSQYTDEGIYTITVTNRYTGRATEKVIYVGTNKILKAHAATGLPLSEIQARLAAGAVITDDGTLLEPGSEPLATQKTAPANKPADSEHNSRVVSEKHEDEINPPSAIRTVIWLVAGVALVIALVAALLVAKKIRDKKKAESAGGEK